MRRPGRTLHWQQAAIRIEADGSERRMADGQSEIESVLLDLSEIGLAALDDLTNPALRRAVARVANEAQSPDDALAGFTSST